MRHKYRYGSEATGAGMPASLTSLNDGLSAGTRKAPLSAPGHLTNARGLVHIAHSSAAGMTSETLDFHRPGLYNFLLHWVASSKGHRAVSAPLLHVSAIRKALTLLVMWGCARFETWPRVVSCSGALQCRLLYGYF